MHKTITSARPLTRALQPDQNAYRPLPAISWRGATQDYLLQLRGIREEKTIEFYAARLKMLLRWVEAQQIPLQEFKARHLRLYLADRAEAGVSEMTRRHDAVATKAFLKFCAQEDYIPDNPLRDYQIAKPATPYVKCPSDEEVRKLLISVIERWKPSLNADARFIRPQARTFFGRRNYAIIAGLVETAARIGEMLNLTLDDYQPELRQIVIREAKGNEPRIVPIGDGWIAGVDAYLRVRPNVPSNRLFINEYGADITVGQFGTQFRGYLKYAGLAGFSLHGLRHYALTKLAEADVWAASQIAGHKDMKITRQYLHSNIEHLHQVHAQAAPLDRLLVNVRSARQRKKVV